MASYGGRKTTTVTVMVHVIVTVLLCAGLCICVDEVPNVDPPEDDTNQSLTRGAEGDVAAADVSTEKPGETADNNPSDVTDSDPFVSESSEPLEDTLAAEEDDESDDKVTQSQDEAEDENESEAPPEENIPTTEEPEVETEAIVEATSVSSQKPKPDSTNEAEERGDFVVRNDAGEICLRACFVASFKVDYIGEGEDGQIVNRTTEITVPEKATAGGWCDRGANKQSVLMLQWDDGRCSLKITFQKVNATKKGDPNFWESRMIQFTFETEDSGYFDAATNAGLRTVHSDPSMNFFPTPLGNSRVCDSEDDIAMFPVVNRTEKVTLEISQLQMQPYVMVNGTFGKGADCGEDLLENPSTNVASIAVGATLACLILVVIIVYAVGRKMGAINDRSGYKSVE